MSFVVLLALLASAPPTAAAPCTLKELSARAGIHTGAGFVEGSQFPAFRTTLAREMTSVTAGLYWSQIHPAPGVWDWSAPDAAVAAAELTGSRVRGHPLLWGRLALPAWVSAITDAAELRAVVTEHVQTIMTRYRGRIADYDVVNEPLTFFGTTDATDGLDPNVFQRVLGPGWIAEALALARAADPDAVLYVNDFLTERPGPKQDRMARLAAELVAAGAPLDGIGFQGHIQIPFAPTNLPTQAELEAAFRRFTALGLEVEVTELDVTLPSRSPCQLDFQREAYRAVLAACLAVDGCTGVTVWGLTDADTWVRRFFNTPGYPLPYDAEFAPKPAYYGMRDALVADLCAPGQPCDLGCGLDPAPARPADCCAATADCATDACVVGRTCSDRTCGAGAPSNAIACRCRPPQAEACADAVWPRRLESHLDRVCTLLARAEGAPAARQRRVLTRIATRLRRGLEVTERAVRAGLLDPACGLAARTDLAERLADVLAARAGLVGG